ncbi:MAG: carboxypeptidase-like regulatory domain-containing protein [Planctomycetota bacterium]|jgi:outer membrane lipoprotein-sorting protein
MRPTENIEKLLKDINIDTNAKTDKAVYSDVIEAFEKSNSKKTSAIEQNIWRIIMKSSITKLTAAAVIIVAILIGINYFGSPIDGTSVAFADVVRPLLAVETGRFKMTIDVAASNLDWINYGDDSVQTIEVMFAGPGQTRWNIPTGEVLVANMQEGKVTILMPAQKEAAIMQVGPPGLIPRHNRFNKLLALRPLIESALETEDESVEFLGEREIEGLTVTGYYVPGPEHHGDITIWADSETKLPVRIEQSMGTQIAVISEIAYNVELDESLFSVQPPVGYSTSSPQEDNEPTFVVTGTVTDATTGQPIVGAKVTDDGYGPEPYKGAITDSQGTYSYLTWPEEHGIKAEAPGYKPQSKGITGLFHVENEDEKVIDFSLERE